MWVGRSGGVRRGSTTTSDRGLRAPAHPASTTAGRGAAVCPLLSRIRIPVLFGTRAPREVVGQIRHPRRLRVFSCITRACPPTPRRRLRALVSPARSSPPISISNDSPPSESTQRERCVGVCRCCARRHGITALLPPAGVCRGAQPALFSQAAPKCAPIHRRECRSVQRAWHHPARPPRRLVIKLVVRSVPSGYLSQPQAVPGLSAPQRERTKTEAATAFALLPRAPRPTKGRYKPFEYSSQRTPSGTFEPPDLMLTWGGRTPSHRRLNTRRRHYFGSGAFCCDLLPAPVVVQLSAVEPRVATGGVLPLGQSGHGALSAGPT